MRLYARLAASMLVCAALAGCSSGWGTLETGYAGTQLKVRRQIVAHWLKGDGRWELQPGDSEFSSVRLQTVDEAGMPWHMQSSAVDRVSNTFTIRDGQTTELAVGPPLTLRTEARAAAPGVVTIALTVTGRAGESYHQQVRNRTGWTGSPGFRIVDQSGELLAKGAFKYG